MTAIAINSLVAEGKRQMADARTRLADWHEDFPTRRRSCLSRMGFIYEADAVLSTWPRVLDHEVMASGDLDRIYAWAKELATRSEEAGKRLRERDGEYANPFDLHTFEAEAKVAYDIMNAIAIEAADPGEHDRMHERSRKWVDEMEGPKPEAKSWVSGLFGKVFG